MDGQTVDLLVVGGGINGVGVARDAAGRGLSVMLVEKDDLAAHTSSASSKLIHGGLRYLEQLDFKLVRESLAERERLLRAAPHIVRPLQFVIAPNDLGRSAWKLRAGLFLYDHLGGRSQLPKSHAVSLEGCGFGAGLKTSAAKAYSYWDACADDSRLVVLNAIDAAQRGAIVRTQTELVGARREAGNWSAIVRSSSGEERVCARAIVNATGPWAKQLFDRLPGARSCNGLRLVKGSHIVLPRLQSGGHALLLQNPDGRVVFAIPFELDFTLVGTTDIAWTGAPDQVAISEAEIDYLLATVAHYFSAAPAREGIVWSYSGVRALVDDGASNLAKVTRDYALELEAPPRQAPLLSVFGGKITTYRHLAERALDRLAPLLSAGKPWTRSGTLPGGEISSVAAFRDELARQHAWAPLALIERFARSYGSRAERILTGVHSLADLGEHFGGGLHAREVEYLIAEEWARTAEDVLFRRSKLGLRLGECGVRRVAAYLAR